MLVFRPRPSERRSTGGGPLWSTEAEPTVLAATVEVLAGLPATAAGLETVVFERQIPSRCEESALEA